MNIFSQTPGHTQGFQLTALYNNTEEKIELLSYFFKEGLERNEYCVWIISGPFDHEKVKIELKKAGIDYCKFPDQLEIIPVNPEEFRENSFSFKIRELLEKKSEYVSSEGFIGLRAGIELHIPATETPFPFIREYKKNLDGFIRKNRIFVLNTCPLKAFSISEVLDFFEESQDTIIKRKGSWGAPSILRKDRAKNNISIILTQGKEGSEKEESKKEGSKKEESKKEESETLVYSEGNFRNILDNLNDAVAIYDLDNRILEINKIACKSLGYSQEEILQMPVWKLKTPKYRAMLKEHKKLILDSGQAVFEVDLLCRDGTIVPHEVNSHLIEYGAKQAILSIGRDISEKKNIFETLKKSEEKFRNIFDNSNDSIIIHDMKGRILEVNRIGCERMGYTYDEMLRMSLEDIKGPGIQKKVKEEIEKFKKYGYMVIEIESLCKDGAVFPCEISNRVINYEGRQAILSIGRDITERKRARQELEKIERRYRTITKMMKLLLYSENVEEGKIDCVGAISEITGYAFDELQKFNAEEWLGLIHPEDLERIRPVHEKCIRKGGDFHEEYRFRQKNGNYIYVEDSGFYLKNKSNRVFKAVGVIKDITDKKLAHKELEKSEERFRIAAEQTGQIIFDYDSTTSSFEWAGAIEELTGYSPEEFRAITRDIWKDHIHPDDREKSLQDYKKARQSANRYRREYRLRRKDGDEFYAEDNGFILRDADGHIRRVIGTIKDISPIKVALEKLRESQARYRSFLQNFIGIIFQIDRNFNMVFLRGRVEEITGYRER